MGIKCQAGEDGYHIPSNQNKDESHPRLILWDCQGKDAEECIYEFDTHFINEPSQSLVAFFNVHAGLEIEEEAVIRGVRGLFYEPEPLDHLPKGIEVIYKGELWLSRMTMSKYILRKRPFVPNHPKKASKVLSHREIEILSLICIGATNEEIAQELCISPHTVKSHIYNIFSKISVPNRLQAALWAGKNL
ncbi:MAG: DNA-binding response regulator [Deltaproteobacteria bacterium]|nr:DNA-binding response regulator [Deltaproteobacteria bacterium]